MSADAMVTTLKSMKLHGMAGAMLWFLDHDFGLVADRFIDLFLVSPNNNYFARGGKCGQCIQQMVNHGSPANRVQDLVQFGFHAGPLARSQDNHG